jgi:hypothetical protein
VPYFRCDRCLAEYYSAAVLTGTECPSAACAGTLKANPFRDRAARFDVGGEDEGDSGEQLA